MIAHLRGKLAQKDPARVIVDVNGVGYEVFVPLTTFTSLPDQVKDAGILFDPYDVRAMASAMARLATDGALREDLRKRGRRRAIVPTWASRIAELRFDDCGDRRWFAGAVLSDVRISFPSTC